MSKNIKTVLLERADFFKETDSSGSALPYISERKKPIIARLLENYDKYAKEMSLNEGTSTADIAKYEPLMAPMLRRTAPLLIGMDLFGTQPMTTPTGLIVCRRSVYHNSKDVGVKRSNSVLLDLTNPASFAVDGAISTAAGAAGTIVYKEDNFVLVKVTSGTFANGVEVDNAATFSAAETTVRAAWDNEAAYRVILRNYSRFDSVELAEAASTNIREMGMVIDKVSVTAESHRLKARYSDEVMQDVRALYGLDVDTEISNILSEDIVNEQNATFLNILKTQAALGGIHNFNYLSKAYGGDADGRWEVEKMFTLYRFINQVANSVSKATMRGPANFLVTSMDVVGAFEALKQWKSAESLGFPPTNASAATFVGMLGKFKVYQDLYAEDNSIYLGYKGNSEWDAGIYYCPYVPLYIKRGMGEEDGQNRIFMNTRYGIGYNPFGAEHYYRKITLSNFMV